ncbi:hypothetical protein Brsp06_04522 [Brucella sp. NBRC 13694]|nr:hypothetical protein DR92_3302 [Brucella anthropi]SUB44231.1 Uncharacterised protein [Brucella anthropi]
MSSGTAIRIPSGAGVSWRAQRVAAGTTTERWRDKRPHGAAVAGGCFCSGFRRVPHRAALARTVRCALLFLIFLDDLHRAGAPHVR